MRLEVVIGKQNQSVELPAGSYVLADPSSVVSHDTYRAALDLDADNDFPVNLNLDSGCMASAWFSNGVAGTENGRRIGVDSGSIGLIATGLVSNPDDYDVLTFDHTVSITSRQDGIVITSNGEVIDTIRDEEVDE